MFRLSNIRKLRLPSVRRMGGTAHGHEEVAYLGGRKPGTPWEDWEKITFCVYAGATGFLTYFFMYAQPESFQVMLYYALSISEFRYLLQSWAMREALAREEAVKNGEEVTFGKFYTPVRSFTEEQSKKLLVPSAYEAMLAKLGVETNN